jgi:hypothetical protein
MPELRPVEPEETNPMKNTNRLKDKTNIGPCFFLLKYMNYPIAPDDL